MLAAEEIIELELDADWTLLSACNTGWSQASSNEAFPGLGQVFFYAGARSLLLFNWPILSASTRDLMVSVVKNADGSMSRAQGLR